MTDASPSPDTLLNGRYRLREIVGQGGMAVVWRAEDMLLDRTIAVKILRDQYARDPEFLERFRSEARSAAALNDPGVVGVYDVGEDGGRHFLVLEYVPGRDLKQVIRDEAPIEPSRAVRIAAAMARAVGQAHAIGMVHRDIKPQNVLIAPDGRMKVADFGIARAVAAAGVTAPGIVMGTVHYLAPEQAAGQPATLSSDVYSLGVVLYEMLTGSVPFKADSGVGVAMKIMAESPAPVEALNPRVPPALADIVTRAMAREPGDRYPNATALADTLDGYLRWTEQFTAPHFRPGGQGMTGGQATAPAAGGPSGGPAITQGPRPPARTPVDTPRPAPAASRGPLLDSTGFLLGLVALAALAMLIPLWMVVADRLGAAPGGDGPGAQRGGAGRGRRQDVARGGGPGRVDRIPPGRHGQGRPRHPPSSPERRARGAGDGRPLGHQRPRADRRAGPPRGLSVHG